MSLVDRLATRFRAEFAGQVAGAVAGAALMLLLARLLEPDEYGLLFFAISVLSVVTLLSKLGIAKSGARYAAEYKERDPSQLRHVVGTTLLYNLVTIAVVTLALFAGYRLLAATLGEPGLEPFFLLGLPFVALSTLTTFSRLLLQGFEAIELSAAVHVANRGGRLVAAVALVVLGYGAFGAFAGYVLAALVATVLGLGAVYARLADLGGPRAPIEDGLRRRIAEYAVPLSATETAFVVDTEVDIVLVGYFLTPVAVSYYVIGKQVVKFIEKPASALGFTLAPTYGAQKAGGNVERAATLYENALVHSLLLYVPAATGLALVAEPTIRLVFGPAYLGAVPVLQVLCAYAVLQAVTRVTNGGLDFLGRARERSIAKVTTAALNVALNLLLIPRMGVIGAAVATVLTYSLYTAVNLYVVSLEFDLAGGRIARQVLQICVVAAVMGGVVLRAVPLVEGIVTLGLVVALGVGVWALLATVAGLLDARRLVSMVT